MLIRARMRSGSCWSDVCILNLSERGLGLQAADPPARGSYVEVRRGPHVIVARVAWTKSHRFGLSCQDALQVDQLVNDDPAHAATVIEGRVERRIGARAPEVCHERSRFRARAMEFACIASIAGAAAMMAFGAVESVLARPLSDVTAALDPGR